MSTSIQLTNIAGQAVAFKIKTTVPDAYIVRPNLGTIAGGGVFEVVVTVKLAKLNQTQRHKFSVEATRSDVSDISALSSIWANVSKTEVQTTLLKVAFVQSDQHSIPTRSSIPPVPEPEKPSALLAGEQLNANLQYTELVKYNVRTTQQQLTAERDALERELAALAEAAEAGTGRTKASGKVMARHLVLSAVAGVIFAFFLIR